MNALSRKITAGSLLKFALPTICMMVVMSAYSVVDGIFISQFVGTTAFSGVNLVYPLGSVVIALATMIGAGTTAIASKQMGEGKDQEARQLVTYVVIASFLMCALLSLLCLIFLPSLIHALGGEGEVYEYSYQYAFVTILFFPFVILQIQFQNIFISNGKATLGLIVVASGGVINIFLDYLFIVVFQMGIQGAALATGIGNVFPAVFTVIYLSLHRKRGLYFVRPKAAGRQLLKIVTNGSSEMISYISASITTVILNLIMMKEVGSDGVAAVAVLMYLDFFLVSVSLGYAMGIAPLIGFNFGEKSFDKLKKINRLSLYFCIGIGVAVTVATFFSANLLSSIFTKPGSAVHEMASHGLRIFGFCYLFKSYNIYASGLFTALSNGKVSALLSLVRTLVFLTASIFIMTALLGVEGIWYSTPIAELLSIVVSILCVALYRKKYQY